MKKVKGKKWWFRENPVTIYFKDFKIYIQAKNLIELKTRKINHV